MGGQDFEYKGDKAKTDDNHDAEGFFTVGDVGYLNEDGYLFLCDRKSDMIIAGGVNIYPAEIEGEILAHPEVGDVAVFGIPDDDMGEQIKAVVEPAAGLEAGDELAASIMEHLAGRLAKFKWPRRSTSSTSSRGSPPASSSSASSATPTGRAGTGPSDGRAPAALSRGGRRAGGRRSPAPRPPSEVADAVAPGHQAREPHVAEHLGDPASVSGGRPRRGRPGACTRSITSVVATDALPARGRRR